MSALPLVALIAMASLVVSLRSRGHPWYRNSYSQKVIDGWTLTHVGHGLVIYGLVKCAFPYSRLDLLSIVVILEVLWESIENRHWVINLFRRGGDKNYRGDSVVNSLSDLAACVAGALFVSFFI